MELVNLLSCATPCARRQSVVLCHHRFLICALRSASMWLLAAASFTRTVDPPVSAIPRPAAAVDGRRGGEGVSFSTTYSHCRTKTTIRIQALLMRPHQFADAAAAVFNSSTAVRALSLVPWSSAACSSRAVVSSCRVPAAARARTAGG